MTALQGKLTAQEAATNQLKTSLGTVQGKLDEQAQTLAQLAQESQQSAEETRRSNDSLTRLMQSMKADLDRLNRLQSGG